MACNISYEFMQIVRVLLQDTSRTLYTDDRLKELIATSARLVMQDVSFDTDYTIGILQRSISPNPFDVPDQSFINLVSLKCACIVDMGDLRDQAKKSGVKITQDRSVIDTSTRFAGFKDVIALGWCNAYSMARDEYLRDRSNVAGQSIFGVLKTVDGFPSYDIHPNSPAYGTFYSN